MDLPLKTVTVRSTSSLYHEVCRPTGPWLDTDNHEPTVEMKKEVKRGSQLDTDLLESFSISWVSLH